MDKQIKEIKPTSEWYCITCQQKGKAQKDPMTFDQMKEHLSLVHNIHLDNKTIAHRETIMHIDGKDYYSWTYKVTVQDVILQNETINPRRDKDYW